MPGGRPTDYTPELGIEICDRIIAGETLIDICSPAHMPNRSTVLRWQDSHKEFCARYQRARELQTDSFADDILKISENETRDYYIDDKGVQHSDNTGVQRDKLKVDTKKFLMSTLNARYAPRTKTENTGAGGGPIQFEAVDRPPTETHEEWTKRVQQQILSKKGA